MQIRQAVCIRAIVFGPAVQCIKLPRSVTTETIYTITGYCLSPQTSLPLCLYPIFPPPSFLPPPFLFFYPLLEYLVCAENLSFCKRLENISIMTVFPPISAVSLSIVVPFGAFDRVWRTKDTQLYNVSGMSRLKPIHIGNVTNQQCSALHSRRAATVSSGSHSSPSVCTLITRNYSLQLLYQRQFLWEGHAAYSTWRLRKELQNEYGQGQNIDVGWFWKILDYIQHFWGSQFSVFTVSTHAATTLCLDSAYVKYLVLRLDNWK